MQCNNSAFIFAPATTLSSSASSFVALARKNNSQVLCRRLVSSKVSPKWSMNNNMPEKEPYPGYFKDMERFGGGQKEAPNTDPEAGKKVGGKKTLLRPDGTPYAPWMMPAYENLTPTEYAKKKSKDSDIRGKWAADPQAQELAGVGLTGKVLGSDVILSWVTGNEEGNMGFTISQRKGKEEETFTVIADYQSHPQDLKSKGPGGGKYSFTVEDLKEGTYVYRVSDVATDGTISDLSQTIVEIESESSKSLQRAALIGFVVVAALLYIVGLFLDPQSGL